MHVLALELPQFIHITIDYQVDYNCFNEPFAVSLCENLYWDMHG